MTGSEYGANEGEVEFGDCDWDYYCQEETEEEARERMSPEEWLLDEQYRMRAAAVLDGDPFPRRFAIRFQENGCEKMGGARV